MVETSDSKLRKMEEEMTRFEAELASQTPQVPISLAQLHYNPPVSYAMPCIPGSQFASPGLISANQYMITSATPGIYMPPNYAMLPTYMPPPNSMQPVVKAKPAVISAPPQVAAPLQLAAAVRANKEAEAAAKLASADDAFDVDDDVTRALLAAAAGVTYRHDPTPSFATACTASSNMTTVAVTKAVPSKTVVVPHSLLPTQLTTNSSSIASKSRLPLLDTVDTPLVRSRASLTEEPYAFQKKVYKRVAAGMVWEDPTLADWDPNDFRIFCGDLGNEVSDDTLVRTFSRYPSFRKAKVVVDKRTGKSRGYGFVSFSDPNDFTRAMREMNGKYVGNRPIKLKRSDWKNRQLETYRKKEKERKKLGLRI